MKTCKKCGVLKEPTTNNFYKQSRRKPDGLHPWCKSCCKKHQKNTMDNRLKRERERWATDEKYRKNRLDIQRRWIDKNREHKREVEKRNRLANPKSYAERKRIYYENNKGKLSIQKRASYEVHKAVDKGTLVKPDACEWCHKQYPIIEAAHHDYSKPLDIKWLCKPCHAKWDYHEPKLMK